ncbi:MAG: hypothetical protein ACRD4X_12505 [Candidatus Acidiferrales bacterium]
MQSNTAAVGNQGVNFASFSAENRKSDPFTVVDGHYIGHDGFVVPKNFEEFLERFPGYVRYWFKKHVGRSTPNVDVEDLTQDLLIHLNSLPANSKYREAGKQDIVQTFDPEKHYGASSARFFNYVNLCLANKLRSIHSRRMKNPLCRPGNLSFTADCEETDRCQVGDEFCHRHSEHLRSRCQRQEKQRDAKHALAEFADFVKREDSSLLRAMEAISSTATSGGAAELLRTTEVDFCRMRSRLRELGRCFLRNEPAPRKRRPYRRRPAIRLSSDLA